LDRNKLAKAVPGLEIEKIDNSKDNKKLRLVAVASEEFITPLVKTWVFVDNLKKRDTSKRVRHFLEISLVDKGDSYYNRRNSRLENGTAFIIRAPGLKPAKLSKLLEGVPVVYSSTLEAPMTVSKNGVVRTKAKLKYIKDQYGWTDGEVFLDDGGYYVQLNRDTPEGINGGTSTLWQILSGARSLGLISKDTNVYGIPRSRSNLEKRAEWKDFITFIKPKVEAALKKNADFRLDRPTSFLLVKRSSTPTAPVPVLLRKSRFS
jgi:hypothetical protein